jgi:hypothetical protein
MFSHEGGEEIDPRKIAFLLEGIEEEKLRRTREMRKKD